MTKRRKRSKKWLGKLVFVLLLMAAGVICYFVWDGYFREKDELDKTSDSGEAVNVVEKQEAIEEKEDVVEPKEDIIQYDGENPNESVSLTGAITYASVVGENLVIRVNIDQYLSGGECTLNLKRGGVVIFEDKASVIDAVSTSTCEGFNVPVNEFGGGGLTVDILVKSGDKSGRITGEVDV